MNRFVLTTILALINTVPIFADNVTLDNIPEIPKRIVERSAQYLNTRSASVADWDPDGNGLLILTRFGNTNQVHHVGEPGAYRKQITFFDEPVAEALYSRAQDRNGFIFRMDVGGGEFFQLYWYDLRTGQYNMITDGKSRNQTIAWSNSGTKLSYSSTKRNGKDFDIYVIDPGDPKSAQMVLQADGDWSAVDWSPDDSKLLIKHYISANESYLFVLDPKTGQKTEINPTNGQKKINYNQAFFSRDGKGVFYTSDEDGEFLQLVYYDLAKKGQTVLTRGLKWDVDDLAVSEDGKYLAFTTNEGGISKLYTMPTSDPTGTQTPDLPQGVVDKLRFDHQSKRLAFSITNAKTPSDVYSVDLATNAVSRWTYSEVGGLNADTFVTPQLIQYPTFDAPRMIPAFYYKPHNEAKKTYPVIIYIHGGPEGQSLASFNANIQYWVNELGAAVLVPNVRGSSGYGKSYLLLDNGMKRMDTVKDIGALLDWIAKQPELDSKRVGVYGGSYGGFMVLAVMYSYNDRLKCGVESYGISNFVTFLQNTQEYRRDLRRAEYGDERDPKMREFLNSISPSTNVSKITIPLFVAQGVNDPRVPLSESDQIVKAVRGNGGTVWYMVAKDEGHGFQKKETKDSFGNAVSYFFEQNLLK
jgi:dipeptidyl aminopeptidase/acylaminoacyl peptidase